MVQDELTSVYDLDHNVMHGTSISLFVVENGFSRSYNYSREQRRGTIRQSMKYLSNNNVC